MLVFTLNVQVELAGTDGSLLAAVDVLSSHAHLHVVSLLDTLQELLIASALPCNRWVVVDFEVVAEELGVAVDVLIFDLIYNAGDLLDALVHCSDNTMFAYSLLHFVDGDL